MMFKLCVSTEGGKYNFQWGIWYRIYIYTFVLPYRLETRDSPLSPLPSVVDLIILEPDKGIKGIY